MADTPTPVTPGKSTTEYVITKVTVALGIVVACLGFAEQFLGVLKDSFPHAVWIGAALTVVGTGTALLKAIGYTQARTAVKVASQEASSTVTVQDPDQAAAHLAQVVAGGAQS